MSVKPYVTNLQIKMSTDCRLQLFLKLAMYILYIIWFVVLNVLLILLLFCLKLPEMYLYPREHDYLILLNIPDNMIIKISACACVCYGRSPEVHRPPAKYYCFSGRWRLWATERAPSEVATITLANDKLYTQGCMVVGEMAYL